MIRDKVKILFLQKIKGIAGSEKYFLELIPRLKEEGFQVDIFLVYDKKVKEKVLPYLKELERNNIDYFTCSISSPLSFKLLKKINSTIKKGDYQILHSHLIHADFWGAIIKRFFKPNILLVSTKHGYEEKSMSKYGLDPKKLKKDTYFRLAKWSEKHIDASYAVSHGLKYLYEKSGIAPEGKLEVIHHGFSQAPSEKVGEPIRKAPQQILVVGRLLDCKGQDLAIQSFQKVLKVFPEAGLLLVGDGENLEKLKRLCKKLNCEDNVFFEGFKKNVTDYYRGSDLVIIPSSSEGFGMVAVEAFQNKKPVIAFDVPALNEVIEHNVNGELIQPFDINALSEAIIRLLKNESQIKKYAQSGREVLNTKFSLNRMVKKTINFYENL